MKEFIGAFILALVLSCAFYSLLGDMPPAPEPVAISGFKEGQLGTKREDGQIGDFNYVNAAAPNVYMTRVESEGGNRDVDFPIGANN